MRVKEENEMTLSIGTYYWDIIWFEVNCIDQIQQIIDSDINLINILLIENIIAWSNSKYNYQCSWSHIFRFEELRWSI